MASAASLSAVFPAASLRRGRPLAGATTRPTLASMSPRRLAVRASAVGPREGAAVAFATAAILLIPEVAEAAQPGMSSSLKNFLLSVVSGGVVLGVIAGAVIAVSNFDPVKRN